MQCVVSFKTHWDLKTVQHNTNTMWIVILQVPPLRFLEEGRVKETLFGAQTFDMKQCLSGDQKTVSYSTLGYYSVSWQQLTLLPTKRFHFWFTTYVHERVVSWCDVAASLFVRESWQPYLGLPKCSLNISHCWNYPPHLVLELESFAQHARHVASNMNVFNAYQFDTYTLCLYKW